MKLIIFIGILGTIIAVKDEFDTSKKSKNSYLLFVFFLFKLFRWVSMCTYSKTYFLFLVDFWPFKKFEIECPENYLMAKIQVSLANISCLVYYQNIFIVHRRWMKRVHTIQ